MLPSKYSRVYKEGMMVYEVSAVCVGVVAVVFLATGAILDTVTALSKGRRKNL
jgi:hypothetical protein